MAFPLIGAGHGGLAPGVALKAMIDGFREFFAEVPHVPIARIVFAVPEEDRHALVAKRLGELLVLR
jgi:hypothetical protein